MGAVAPAFFDRLASLAIVFLVAESAGVADAQRRVVGFLLALPPHVPYDSPNYQWFEERYDDFVYIDRVAVAPGDRGSGVGRALYEALDATLAAGSAATGAPRLCCEVNLRPPNPGSLEFHRRLGFVPVGEQDTEEATKRVVLLVREPPASVPDARRGD